MSGPGAGGPESTGRAKFSLAQADSCVFVKTSMEDSVQIAYIGDSEFVNGRVRTAIPSGDN